MTRRSVSIIFAVVVSVALLLAGIVYFAEGVAAAPASCRIQGAWISTFEGGPWDTPLYLQETITPQDPAGNKLIYVMRLVNGDATFGFPFPPFTDSDYLSELVGEAVRTGRDTYDFSLLGYGVEERAANRNKILFIWTVTGSMECVDENHKTDNVYLSVYMADQDADQDGFPDEGEAPFWQIGPTTLAVGKRVP